MGQVHLGGATTTEAVRRAIQCCHENLRSLARHDGINLPHYHYDDHRQLQQHLEDFVSAYNFGSRLKTPRGRAPNPFHQVLGLNT